MPLDQPHSALIARVYEAAAGLEPWTAVIADIARGNNAATGVIYDFDRRIGRAVLLGSYNFDPDLVVAYESYYSTIDIWHRRLLSWPVGQLNGTHRLTSDEEVLRSEFYNDHLRRAGIFYAGGALVDHTPDNAAVFGIQRDRHHGPFIFDADDPLVSVVKHMRRALKIHRYVAKIKTARDLFAALLDQTGAATLMVDAEGRILYVNRLAGDLLDHRAGLRRQRGDQLAALRGEDTRRLLAAIRQATGAGAPGPAGETVVLPRPGGPPLVVLVAPLRNDAGRRVAGLFVEAPPADKPAEAMARQCGLTAAETRLFVDLAEGHRLADIAERRGVSVNTLRIHLGRIFDKTGTHRQAELVRFALGGPSGGPSGGKPAGD